MCCYYALLHVVLAQKWQENGGEQHMFMPQYGLVLFRHVVYLTFLLPQQILLLQASLISDANFIFMDLIFID